MIRKPGIEIKLDSPPILTAGLQALFELKSGHRYDENKCKAMVIYGPKDNSSDDDIEVTGCGMLVPKVEKNNHCN